MLPLRHFGCFLARRAGLNTAFLLLWLAVSLLAFPVQAAEKRSKPLTLFIAGDVMLGRGVAPFLRNGAPGTSLTKWRSQISGADIAFCNLECVFSSSAKATAKRLLADPRSAFSLSTAGFDVVSVANNHALDAGSGGLQLTIKTLNDIGIAALGGTTSRKTAPINWPAYEITVRKRRIAFLAASAWGPFLVGAARVRPLAGSNLIEQVQQLSENALVFVSLHWGLEHQARPTAAQRRFAHRLLDAGAAAIIGHHPHLVQEVETYHGRPIFYSLGNFLFDRMPLPQSGLAATLTIDNDNRVSVQTFPVQPMPQAEQSARTVKSRDGATTLRLIAHWLLPRNEQVRKVIGARLLSGSRHSQLLIWSQAPAGHRLRAYQKNGKHWRLLAQGRHAAIFDMQCGRVTRESRDDRVQIVLGLQQRSKLDVRVRNRLHVYELNPRGGFRPLWRGSGLSRPFRAYTLLPGAGGLCDLVAVEQNQSPEYRGFDWITVYRWNDFGFRVLWDTPVRGKVANLRFERDDREPKSSYYVIRFEQKQKDSTRTLTLRSFDDTDSGTRTFKAIVEP